MKFLVAALALTLSACVIRFPDDPRRPHDHTILVCVFASCRDVCRPEKQKTPTPAASPAKGKRADLQASRLDPDARRQGIGPN